MLVVGGYPGLLYDWRLLLDGVDQDLSRSNVLAIVIGVDTVERRILDDNFADSFLEIQLI